MPILLPILVSCSSSSPRDQNYDSGLGQDFMPDLAAGGATGTAGSGAAGSGAAGSGAAGTSGAAGAGGTAGSSGVGGQGGSAGASSGEAGGSGSAGAGGSSGATADAQRATGSAQGGQSAGVSLFVFWVRTHVENEWTGLPGPRKIPPHHDGRTPRLVQLHTES